MRSLIISLALLSAISARAVEYMKNDGTNAPETIDRAVDEHQHQEEMQKEEAEGETAMTPKEAVTPQGNAQEIQAEEAEVIEDNYLIGPYDRKGKIKLPTEDEKKKRQELEQDYIP